MNKNLKKVTMYRCIHCEMLLDSDKGHNDIPSWIKEGAVVINTACNSIQVVLEDPVCGRNVKVQDVDGDLKQEVGMMWLGRPTERVVENLRYHLEAAIDGARNGIDRNERKLELLDKIEIAKE